MRMRTLILLLATCVPLAACGEERVLFGFDGPEAGRGWQAVNDGVMGGRSDGRFRLDDAGQMEFFGTLSLENNGGFASVRTMGRNLGLKPDDVIVARVKGDGRTYTFNVYAGRNRTSYSYRQEFATTKGEWIEVAFPVDAFTATWRGRVFPNEKLEPTAVTGVGFLLGDKKPGPFKLDIDWIKVGRPAVPANAAE